jgi:hypothetical protein
LSAYPPLALVLGLSGIVVRHGGLRHAEAAVLAKWSQTRLVACGAPEALATTVEASDKLPDDSVELLFTYTNEHEFRFAGDFAKGCAQVCAHIHGSKTELSTAIGLLSPEAALAEAMFF